MKRLVLALASRYSMAALAIALSTPLLAQKSASTGNCTTIPTSWTFNDQLSGATIKSDGLGIPYQNGVDGVNDTAIQSCSGSYDATMNLSRSKRSVSMQFPAPLDVDPGPAPSFAGGQAFPAKATFNIRNVLDSGNITSASPATIFYTVMTVQFPAPDGNTYRLFFNPTDPCPTSPVGTFCPPVSDIGSIQNMNTQYSTSWVKVTYTPPTYDQQSGKIITYATWLVDGEMLDSEGHLQVGALGNGSNIQVGQYVMPFQILITTTLTSF